eukprot:3166322-Rhodomonas_salina.1
MQWGTAHGARRAPRRPTCTFNASVPSTRRIGRQPTTPSPRPPSPASKTSASQAGGSGTRLPSRTCHLNSSGQPRTSQARSSNLIDARTASRGTNPQAPSTSSNSHVRGTTGTASNALRKERLN